MWVSAGVREVPLGSFAATYPSICVLPLRTLLASEKVAQVRGGLLPMCHDPSVQFSDLANVICERPGLFGS